MGFPYYLHALYRRYFAGGGMLAAFGAEPALQEHFLPITRPRLRDLLRGRHYHIRAVMALRQVLGEMVPKLALEIFDGDERVSISPPDICHRAGIALETLSLDRFEHRRFYPNPVLLF